MKRDEFFLSVAEDVIALMREHGKDWIKPWASQGAPRNPLTGTTYRGMNTILLGLTALRKHYDAPLWATLPQINKAGGAIRKGEKGVQCMFFQRRTVGEGDDERVMATVKFFWLFNILGQTTLDIPRPPVRESTPFAAETLAWAQQMGVQIEHGGDRAYYAPALDRIQMPPAPDFTSDGAYAATLFHEMVHATGHKDRLDRFTNQSALFGNKDYALEELVAELGAAMLCQHRNTDAAPRGDHARYLNNWVQALSDKPGALATAASKATSAVSWIVTKIDGEETIAPLGVAAGDERLPLNPSDREAA